MKYALFDENGKVIKGTEVELRDDVQVAAFEKAGFKPVVEK